MDKVTQLHEGVSVFKFKFVMWKKNLLKSVITH